MSARGRKERGLRVREAAAPGSSEGRAGGPSEPRGKEPKGVRQRAAEEGCHPRSGLCRGAAWTLPHTSAVQGVCQGRPVSRAEGRSRSKMPRPATALPPSPCPPTKAASVWGDGSLKRHGRVPWWGEPHLPILTTVKLLHPPCLSPSVPSAGGERVLQTRLPALPGLILCLTPMRSQCAGPGLVPDGP